MVYGANDNKSKYRTNWFYLLEVLKKANRVIIANFNSGQAMKVIGPLSRSLNILLSFNCRLDCAENQAPDLTVRVADL